MHLIPPRRELLERIHRLWDRVADFDAADTDAALRLLLEETARMVSAQNAYWLGGVRMSKDDKDPFFGWRVLKIQYLHPTRPNTNYARSSMRALDRGNADPEVRVIARDAGSFRALRLGDLDLPHDQLEASRAEYRRRGIHDVLRVLAPVSADAEGCYGFHRKTPRESFTAEEMRVAAYTMRGIKEFHRRVLLSHGVLAAQTPLAPAERRVLALLLTPRSEKQIASALGVTATTAHTYVSAILRKFGVSGRSGLTALWLGSAPQPRHPP